MCFSVSEVEWADREIRAASVAGLRSNGGIGLG